MVVFTQVSGKMQDFNITALESAGQKIQSGIAILNTHKPGSKPDILTKGFYSARSPEISYDGEMMLFSAQQKEGDNWQIWEMNLSNSKLTRVTSLPENCFDPAYLPDGKVIFSKQTENSNLNSGLTMFTCNSDGTDVMQVTFDPYSYSSASVLNDGRVLTISRKTSPENGESVFMVLRPDGTKNVLFYKGSEGSHPGTRGWETKSGKIVFIETVKDGEETGDLISINYNRPLHTYANLSSGIGGSFISVFPLKSGEYLVSYRKSGSDRFGLYEFDPENKVLGQPVYVSDDFDIAEIVAVEKRERPKKLPSEVDKGVKTGLLLCQDVNFHDMNTSQSASLARVNKIKIIGKDSVLGEIDVESDGSFYMKVIADTQFQIQTVDNQGNVVGDPCGWIYLRPNERRGCVGCHEDHEQVPENRIPLAVRMAPVNVPVHISKVVEKKVSLE